MGSMHNNERLLAMIGNAEWLAVLAQAQEAGADVPLSHVAFIDGSSTQTAQNGAISLPFHTISNWLTNIGVGVSAADSLAMRTGLLTPNTPNVYTENLAIPAWRNVELRGLTYGGGGNALLVTGNITWTNTAAGGGTHAPSAAVLRLQNVAVLGNITETDDTVTSAILIGSDFIESGSIIQGDIVTTGCTHLATIAVSNTTVIGNITSLATAAGAIVNLLNALVTGAIVANNVAALSSQFGVAGSAGSGNITVPSTATCVFKNCSWATSSAPVLTGVAGATATFDGPTWNSFLEAGGTTSNITVLVVGGSQAGIVANSTSLGNADVNISLNGTGASAGLTGGGNFYRETTALTGSHSVTAKTGGGEQTGDTIDILKTDTAAQTYLVKNNAATTLVTFPVSVKGWARIQFNTVVPNDWGLIGFGSGAT